MKQLKTLLKMQPNNLLNYLLEKSNEPLSFYVDNNTRYTFAMTKNKR